MGEFESTIGTIQSYLTAYIAANIFWLIVGIILRIVCYIVTAKLAIEKDRDVGIWICLVILLGWAATIILAVTKAPPYDNNETVETESSANYSLTGKKTASTSNVFTTYNQPKPKPVVKTEKWTCSCGQVNNPNATMCIECGKEKE